MIEIKTEALALPWFWRKWRIEVTKEQQVSMVEGKYPIKVLHCYYTNVKWNINNSCKTYNHLLLIHISFSEVTTKSPVIILDYAAHIYTILGAVSILVLILTASVGLCFHKRKRKKYVICDKDQNRVPSFIPNFIIDEAESQDRNPRVVSRQNSSTTFLASEQL